MAEFNHISVLLEESINGLNIKKGGYYVDATTGGGGHSYHILERLESGQLYCFDQDIAAIEASEKKLSNLSSQKNYTMIHSNFKHMQTELEKLGVKHVDGILFDLGVSSFQFDEASRGFSYRFDGELDMRMDQRQVLTAKTIVNTYSEEDLAKIFFLYGEEKYSRQIAKCICNFRKNSPINTTLELVEIIKQAVPKKYAILSGHPAKKTFQALRIEVNSELSILRQALIDALDLLNPKGRLAVITFHSLEDRIVKELFKEKSSDPAWNRNMPISNSVSNIEYKLVTTKPILPTEEEINNNPRSHSAKLRIIEKI